MAIYINGEKINKSSGIPIEVLKPEQAKTAIPSLSQQIIFPDSGKVLSEVTVEPITPTLLQSLDSDFKAENIPEGMDMFGLTGTMVVGGDIEAFVTRTITEYENESIKTVGDYAFYSYSSLTNVSFPACTYIGSYAFYKCSSLTNVSFPACTYIGSNAFAYCYRLSSASFPACTSIGSNAFFDCSSFTSASFPACTYIGSYAFAYCSSSLTNVSFPACTSIGSNAFYNCYRLSSASFPACTYIGGSAFAFCSSFTTIELGASTVCTLANSNAFNGTSIATSQGYIYVPSSLVTSYKQATNWAYFSSRIFAG